MSPSIELIYGTTDGKIGAINIDNLNEPRAEWAILDDTKSGGKLLYMAIMRSRECPRDQERLFLPPGVTCLDIYDLNGDGTRDLITGRNDGSVEVFYFNDEDKPVKRFSYVRPNITGSKQAD